MTMRGIDCMRPLIALLSTWVCCSLVYAKGVPRVYSDEGMQLNEVVNSKVNVIIEPMRITRDDHLANTSATPICQLSIHKDDCFNPRIRRPERISWDTRICFKWNCITNETKFFVRPHSCWTGSIQNPIMLINSDGCSTEESMISTPKYVERFGNAESLGWLSVRLYHMDHIRLSCALRICDLCASTCEHLMAPLHCKRGSPYGNAILASAIEPSPLCPHKPQIKERSNANSAQSWSMNSAIFISLALVLVNLY